MEGSLLAAVTRICMQCGENVVSGMIYALLGVSAMTRVSFKKVPVFPIRLPYFELIAFDVHQKIMVL